jgi:hypothetical protein
MNKLILIILLSLLSIKIYSQNSRNIEGAYNSISRLYDFDKEIESLDSIPKTIIIILNNNLNDLLGDLKYHATFQEGLCIDLDNYFKENPIPSIKKWVITKYQFVYLISCPEIGLSKYYLKFKMDEYGQVIECNWPKKYYNSIKRFEPIESIVESANKWAKENSLERNKHTTEIRYNKKLDKLCIAFSYIIDKKGNKETIKTIEFDWLNGLKVDEFSSGKLTVN